VLACNEVPVAGCGNLLDGGVALRPRAVVVSGKLEYSRIQLVDRESHVEVLEAH